MQPKTRALLSVNTGILIMSIAGLFAKLIPWDAPYIILGRMALGAPFVLLFVLSAQLPLRLHSRKDAAILTLLGGLLSLHWMTYFAAIQVSTVAIGVVTVWIHPVITTFIEPLLQRHRPAGADVILALLAFVGIFILTEKFSLQDSSMQGVLLGTFSGCCMAVRNVFSRRYVQKYSGGTVMFYQLVAGAFILSPLLLTVQGIAPAEDFIKLLILAVVATAAGHTLTISGLKHLTARTAGVISSIQPVYLVILAYFILDEVPTWRVYAGGFIIISVVVIEALRQRKTVA